METIDDVLRAIEVERRDQQIEAVLDALSAAMDEMAALTRRVLETGDPGEVEGLKLLFARIELGCRDE